MNVNGPARSALFLTEMGIAPLWRLRHDEAPALAPQLAAPGAAPAAAEASPALPYAGPSAPPIVRHGGAAAHVAAPATAPVGDEEIAVMDWPALRAGVAACTRCSLRRGVAAPVPGAGAATARWLVAGGASGAADEEQGRPLAGEPGVLLANMLAAVGHGQASDTYITNLIKCRPVGAGGGERAPDAAEVAACRPWLERELVLTGATMVLTLGQIAANGLRGRVLHTPLAGARGQVAHVNGVATVATLHPGELLRRGADKALAWADLCCARAHDDDGL